MPDYRRPLEFGVSVSPDAADWDTIRAVAQEADRLGLDLVGIQDHPYQRRFLDTMALLAALAAATSRVRLFPDVACLPLRPPAMLAKEAASIDVMSGGRFEMGLGAGASWEAIEAMGGSRRSPGEALAALDEAVEVLRLLWSGRRGIRFSGDHYAVQGVHSGPVPPHRIEIWLGVLGPRALRLLGRVADGWVPSIGRITPDELEARQLVIDEAAREAGRRPEDIRRLANVPGRITSGEPGGFLQGPADQWVEELTELALRRGVDTFVVWPEGDALEQVRRLADVVPAVRAAVTEARR